jgi:hypothetical protein
MVKLTIQPNSPGIYDDKCTEIRKSTRAVACLLIVIEGDLGSGFSVQSHEPELLRVLPALLRQIADDIAEEQRQKADA